MDKTLQCIRMSTNESKWMRFLICDFRCCFTKESIYEIQYWHMSLNYRYNLPQRTI